MFTGVSHITLFVASQTEALDFYQKLGFIIHTDAPFGPMRWLTICLPQHKNLEVVLMQAETEAEKQLVGRQAALKPLISFETSDCYADYKKLQGEGVQFVEGPTEQPWGVSALFKDLYGNHIYMCQSHVPANGKCC